MFTASRLKTTLDLGGFSVPTLYIQKGLQSMKQFNYKSKNNHIQIKIDIESPREYKNNIIKKWKSRKSKQHKFFNFSIIKK